MKIVKKIVSFNEDQLNEYLNIEEIDSMNRTINLSVGILIFFFSFLAFIFILRHNWVYVLIEIPFMLILLILLINLLRNFFNIQIKMMSKINKIQGGEINDAVQEESPGEHKPGEEEQEG